MSGLFGKKRNQSAAVEEDAISDDLLNAIPELVEGSDGDAPVAAPAPAPAPAQAKKFVPVSPPSAEVHQLIAGVRREMETVFVKELDRVEGSFASLLAQMEQRLKAANDQLTHLEQERAALEQANAQYSRKFAALKQITDDA